MTEEEREQFQAIVRSRLQSGSPPWQRLGQVAGAVVLGASEVTAIILLSWQIAAAGLIAALTIWMVTGLLSPK